MKPKRPTKSKALPPSAPSFDGLVRELREFITESRRQIVRAVDVAQVRTCRGVGRHIVEFEQGGAVRAEYGAKLLPRLAEALTADFGKGFDERNLRHMRLFYLVFPIRNALRSEWSWTHPGVASLRLRLRSGIGLALMLAGLLCPAPYSAFSAPPNVIHILADDLGYGDLGCYGQKLIHTPRLDRMAAQGMKFTQHYAGAPSCHPSRCVLFTGKHTGHARIRENCSLPLLPEDMTITQMFKQAGYVTGAVGKWALGLEDSTGAPWKKGVDEFLGYLDQTHAHTYYPDYLWKNGQRLDLPENANGQRVVYSHDLFAKESLDFIRRHKDQPFFFYAAFTLPHAEVTVPEDSLAEYRGKWPEPKKFAGSKTYCPQDQPRAVRAAMISRLDRDIGRILDLLDELHLADNTLVIFTSDNGPITAGGQDPDFFNSTGPLRGLKFTLYEGGIREPFLARWPGKIPPGSVSDHVSDFADMFPTYAELIAATPPPGLDGVSFLPTLLGKPKEQTRRALHYWEAAPQQAIRVGNWKAYRPAPDQPIQLYDLAKDISETTDLAKQNPAKTAELAALMEKSRTDSPEFPLQAKPKKKK